MSTDPPQMPPPSQTPPPPQMPPQAPYPYPYPYYAPPPSPPQPPRNWRSSHFVPMVIGVLIAIVLVGLYALTGSLHPQPAAAADTPTPFVISGVTPLASPTPDATDTPTPPCKLICDSVLGGVQDTFTADFGDPELRGDVPWYTYDDGSGTSIEICLCDLEAGTDHHNRVDLLSFYPTDGSTLSSSDALALAKSFFFPSDAVHVRDFTDPDVGRIHVYRSAQLARTFPAGDFTNANTNAIVTRGTFSIGRDDPAGTGCTLYLGE